MNKKKEVKRSPLFYVGDKYKLVPEISTYFPKNINKFIEPFVGGGSVFLNVNATKYLLNDIDENVISIHKYLCSFSQQSKKFFDIIFSIIDDFGLSCSFKEDNIPISLKEQYKKTYFAKYNKSGFLKLRDYYNNSDKKDVSLLYVLLIYGFNRMIRFNKDGNYNLPVGNVDFNNNTFLALQNYFETVSSSEILWSSADFQHFLNSIHFEENDFVYLDPPYLITFSEYNKLWNNDSEVKLLKLLDALNNRGIRFALSNVLRYKGKSNDILINWANGYNINSIKSNYISYHDNSVKQFDEVLITNY